MEAVLGSAAKAGPGRAFLRRDEASAYLFDTYGVSFTKNTLAVLAVNGGGPAFQKCGRAVLYPVAELDRWIAGRMSGLKQSTSE